MWHFCPFQKLLFIDAPEEPKHIDYVANQDQCKLRKPENVWDLQLSRALTLFCAINHLLCFKPLLQLFPAPRKALSRPTPLKMSRREQLTRLLGNSMKVVFFTNMPGKDFYWWSLLMWGHPLVLVFSQFKESVKKIFWSHYLCITMSILDIEADWYLCS